MWRVERPGLEAVETFDRIVRRVRDAGLRARLIAITAEVENAADVYEAAGNAARLDTVPASPTMGAGSVSNREMIGLYERIVNRQSPLRPIYDSLVSACEYDRCPLCGHRLVATLDHHLPKRHYSAFTVLPMNLVPACRDCNFLKLDTAPTSPEDVPLHPYFDDVEDDRWLYAEVLEVEPAALRYYVVPDEHWDEVTAVRVQRQFNRLELSRLYGSQAAQELSSIRQQLTDVFDAAGLEGVRSHLSDQAASREAAWINSWQTALYEALAESDWFCGGGFNYPL